MIQAANPITSPADSARLGPLLSRLDEIRRELDRDDVELEDQMTLYREACGHIASAKRMLGEHRAEIELLMTETEAGPERVDAR
jgi:exonuclease VII small subunit